MVDTLIELAGDPGISDVRSEIVSALAPHAKRQDVRAMVIDAIVNAPGAQVAWRFSVSPDEDWKKIFEEFLQALKVSRRRPNEIEAAAIVRGLKSATKDRDDWIPSGGTPSKVLEEALIEASLKEADNKRMTEILGRLLVQAVDGDQETAGARINAYESQHPEAEAGLRKLREAVGGSEALEPIMSALKDNLAEFDAPIRELNVETRAAWELTIKNAQDGFRARMWMSGVVFAVGIFLLAVSSYKFLSGSITGADLYGAGVPFVSGLAMTLLVVYRGPLAEIRQSVNDVAIANASFIAFVHRVMETSITFSHYYLKQEMTFENLGKANTLIQSALMDTVRALRLRAIDSSKKGLMDVFDRATSSSGPSGSQQSTEAAPAEKGEKVDDLGGKG